MRITIRTPKTLALVACLLASAQVGCNKKKENSAPAPAAAPVVEVNKNIDQELLSALKDAAVDCKVLEKQQRVNCAGAKKNALVLSFNRGDRKRVGSLPTLTEGLKDKDPKVGALTSAVLYGSFRLGFGKDAENDKPKPDVAASLLAAALALPPSAAMQAIPAATHAATLSGQTEALLAKLDKNAALQIRTMAYRYLMVYGRLSVFNEIKTIAKDPSTAVALAAIESPRNMKDWTTKEQEQICPWATAFLEDKRPPVAGNATAVLSNCAGEHLDALITRIEQLLKDGSFSFVHSTALRDMCRTSKSTNGAADEQCERVRKIQESVVQDSKMQPRVRAMTLSSLAHRWPDKQTLALAKKLESTKELELKKAAEQSVRRLNSRVERDASPQKK
jgi:hypothetical protein